MPRKPTKDRPARHGDGWVEQRPNGRWQARWHDGDRYRARTVDTEDEAYQLIRSQSAAVRAGTYIEPAQLTVADGLYQWLDRHAHAGVRPSTIQLYTRDVAQHIIPALGHLRIVALTTPPVQAWIDRMRTQGAAPTTIRNRVVPLKMMLTECVRLGIIAHAPTDHVRIPAASKKRLSTWSAAETARVIAAATARGPMWAACYTLALTTGLRPGELRALRWTDLDLTARSLRVQRTATHDLDGREIIGDRTKTGRDRAVELAPAVVAALQHWKSQQTVRSINNYVFVTPRGTPLTAGSFSDTHHEIVAAAGVPYLHPHGMRHTAATLLLEAGVPLKVVSDILGHTTIAITADIYMHVDASLQRTAMTLLSDLIMGKTHG